SIKGILRRVDEKGLQKISDLGELWQKESGQLIPLGGIVIRRNFPESIKQKINFLMRQSVEYALTNPQSSYDYVKKHAQEMSEEVRKKHIELYVNKFSLDLGTEGKKAIENFLERAGMKNSGNNLFVS
ncbi:MAG: MqnA/MqnD/SBP family protein, partial [bacterium]